MALAGVIFILIGFFVATAAAIMARQNKNLLWYCAIIAYAAIGMICSSLWFKKEFDIQAFIVITISLLVVGWGNARD